MHSSGSGATLLKIALTAFLAAVVVILVGLYAKLLGDTHGELVQAVVGLTLAAMVAIAADPLIGAVCDWLLRRPIGSAVGSPKLLVRVARARRNVRG